MWGTTHIPASGVREKGQPLGMAVETPSFAPDARRIAHMSVRLARKAGGWEQSGEFADGDTETGHGNGP